MATSPQEIIDILNLPPSKRNPDLINLLVHHTENAKFFKELRQKSSDSAHLACCQHMGYQFCPEDEYLFKFGDHGTKFYIVLAGKVGIEVPIPNEETGELVMTEVIQLGAGAAFGELALENDKPRAASIKCKEDTHFATLEKTDYNRILAKLVKERRMAIVNFLQNLPLFKDWTKGTLTKLSYYFKEYSYIRKQTVYKEGSSADAVYFIRNGEFKIVKILKFGLQQMTPVKKMNIIEKKTRSTVHIATLGEGEIFGDDDVCQQKEFRTNTCICTSNTADVLTISKNDFFKRIRKVESLNYIKSRMQDKHTALNNRIEYATFLESEKNSRIVPKRPSLSRAQSNTNSQQGVRKSLLVRNAASFQHRKVREESRGAQPSFIKPFYANPMGKEVAKYSNLRQLSPYSSRAAAAHSKTNSLPPIYYQTLIKLKNKFENESDSPVSKIQLREKQRRESPQLSVFSINSYPVYKTLWDNSGLRSHSTMKNYSQLNMEQSRQKQSITSDGTTRRWDQSHSDRRKIRQLKVLLNQKQENGSSTGRWPDMARSSNIDQLRQQNRALLAKKTKIEQELSKLQQQAQFSKVRNQSISPIYPLNDNFSKSSIQVTNRSVLTPIPVPYDRPSKSPQLQLPLHKIPPNKSFQLTQASEKRRRRASSMDEGATSSSQLDSSTFVELPFQQKVVVLQDYLNIVLKEYQNNKSEIRSQEKKQRSYEVVSTKICPNEGLVQEALNYYNLAALHL